MYLSFFLEGIDFPSKHNVAPLYWPLPLSVFCRLLRQIMMLSDHSLIAFIFNLVKEYKSTMNLEILILHFENKICFDANFKIIHFWNLATHWLFFSWKRDDLLLCWQYLSLVKVRHEVTFCFYEFQSEGLEKKLKVLFEKNYLFLNTHFIVWIIMSSLFLMSWLLWKGALCILRALFINPGCLLAWLKGTFTIM